MLAGSAAHEHANQVGIPDDRFRVRICQLVLPGRVLRDLDLLKKIHEQAFVSVCFSITLHDERTKAIFEPKSSATWERFDALKEIRKAGLYGGVMGVPIIPTIGDTYENMLGLAKAAKQVNAEFILFAGMTMKPGRQKDSFFRDQKGVPCLVDFHLR